MTGDEFSYQLIARRKMIYVGSLFVILILFLSPTWCQNHESLEDFNSSTIDIESRSLKNFGKKCNYRRVSPGTCTTLTQCRRSRRPYSQDAAACGGRFNGVVCCKSSSTEEIVSTTTRRTGPIWGGATKATTLRTPSLQDLLGTRLVVENSFEEIEEECGVVRHLQTTIFNGQESRGDFPFMVALVTRGDGSHFCGGVLITRRHVLTAAHCFNEIPWRDVDVRVGQDDLTDKEFPGTEANIKSVKIHERYSKRGRQRISPVNDIAIITLDRKITRKRNVPICLPKETKDVSKTGSEGIVAGWGQVFRGRGPSVNKLQYTRIPTKSHKECKELYLKQAPEDVVHITSDMVCGGNEVTDACRGDSGGPLMFNTDWTKNRYEVWGVVSFGPSACANKDLPGVYTRVDKYLDWIERNTQ